MKPIENSALPLTFPAVFLAVLLVLLMATLMVPAPLAAVLPEPDHTIYGTAYVDDAVATTGTATVVVDGEVLASYDLGSDPALGTCDAGGCLFALRVPMDFAEPRLPGRARTGDDALLFLDGVLAGEATIGGAGEAQALDLDSQFAPRIPGLVVMDASGSEALAGPFGLDVPVTLRLSFPADDPVTVEWSTADGDASSGTDYDPASGTATFDPGETTATVTVKLLDDALPEADPARRIAGEFFFVELSNPTEAVLLDPVGRVTILDDDTPPALSVSNLSVVEPPADAVAAAFTVRLSHLWDQDVSFTWSAVDGTAGALDYALLPGSAVIAAGDLEAEIPLQVFADGETEGDETFTVQLGGAVGAVIRSGGGRGTILSAPRRLQFVEVQRDGEAGADGLFGAIDLEVSPDGRHVVAAGRGEDALAVYEREGGTGRLAFVAAYRNGSEGLSGLAGLEAVAVSPAGDRVYAAAFDDAAVAVFERDVASGELTLLEIERSGRRDDESGETVEGLAGAIAMVAADGPGGEHLYVAGSEADSLAVFSREPTGLLRYTGLLRDEDPGVQGLGRVVALALAPGGEQLYAASLDGDALAVFDRDPLSGALTFVEVHVDGGSGGGGGGSGSGPIDGLDGAAAVAVSPDGANVYVIGQQDAAVAVFERRPDGRLTFLQALVGGSGGVDALALATDVAVSRDGVYVYATAFGDDALSVFERAGDGTLTQVEVERDDVGGIDGLDGATALAVSPDDLGVYATGTLDDAVAVFRRDLVVPTAPELTSPSHLTGGYSADALVELQWSGAFDEDAGSGIGGYVVRFDDAPDTEPSPGTGDAFVPHGLDPHAFVSEPQPDGDRYAHVATCDHSGNCTTSHLGPFHIDTTAPSNPDVLFSTSHQVGVWTPDDVLDLAWSGAADVGGLAGYSLAFDTDPNGVPDATLDVLHGSDPHTVSRPNLADGNQHYVHLSTCDLAGLCAAPTTLGPFAVDVTPPGAPTNLGSPTHTPGAASNVLTITVTWDAATDVPSGVVAYAWEFDAADSWSCDGVADGDETALSATFEAPYGGTWYAHVCAVDAAGNPSPVATAGPFAISTAPATVTAVATVADTGDGRLDEGEITIIPITQLSVDFSWPMADPVGDDALVDVTNPQSWRLVSDGGDGTLESTDCAGISPSDRLLEIDRVDYASESRRARLFFVADRALAAGRHRLLGCAAGLHDQAGAALDGDADGTAGTDFSLDFTVQLENLLRNPNLDEGLDPWIVLGAGIDPAHDALDADDLPTSGSALLAGPGGPGDSSAIGQCVAVESGLRTLRARVRVDGPADPPPVVHGLVQFFGVPGCQGVPSASFADSWTGDGGGAWRTLEAEGKAPPAVRSALVSFSAQWNDTTATDVYFDVLYFGDSAGIFSDGFESGATDRWSAQVPTVP